VIAGDENGQPLDHVQRAFERLAVIEAVCGEVEEIDSRPGLRDGIGLVAMDAADELRAALTKLEEADEKPAGVRK
jgi:hypothetical protein